MTLNITRYWELSQRHCKYECIYCSAQVHSYREKIRTSSGVLRPTWRCNSCCNRLLQKKTCNRSLHHVAATVLILVHSLSPYSHFWVMVAGKKSSCGDCLCKGIIRPRIVLLSSCISYIITFLNTTITYFPGYSFTICAFCRTYFTIFLDVR